MALSIDMNGLLSVQQNVFSLTGLVHHLNWLELITAMIVGLSLYLPFEYPIPAGMESIIVLVFSGFTDVFCTSFVQVHL